MKTILKFILLALLSLTIYANDSHFKVKGVTLNEREGNITLHHFDKGHLRLDCSSFMHGLYLEDDFFYLYEYECLDIYEKTFEVLKAGSFLCLSLDLIGHTYSLRPVSYSETCSP